MLRRLGIRGKVLAALAGPVLVLVLLAGILSLQSASDARSSGDGGVIAGLLAPHAEVIAALQAERSEATAQAAGRPGANLDGARAATDQAVAVLIGGMGQVSADLLGGRIADLLAMATSMQDSVDMVRGGVDGMPEGVVDGGYSQLINGVVAMPVLLSERMAEPDLAAEFRAYGLALSASEQLAHEAPYVAAVLTDPYAEASAVRRLPALIALTAASLEGARSRLTALGDARLELAPTSDALAALRQALGSGSPEAIAGADAGSWASVTELQDRLGAIRAELINLVHSDADALKAAASRQALLTAAAAAAAVLLSLLLALVVARSIVVPMRRLTTAAATVRDELPRLIEQVAVPGRSPDLSLVEIPVTSSDEVGRLAAAFNEVNATTISVAQEQAALRGSIAEMFVNVARRDQVLLNRQLSFIDALERSEEDPKVLADLFRLDHLATRMRRNAESLLVLAGIDTGRRLRDTLPLSDVVRTASSEIEHYERVLLELPTDPVMLGHTALPAAHLLAELLENATMFSEPGSPVHVSTGRDETHVLITVLDQGLGMTPEELDAAQAKIASASAGEVLGAQRLGMFVIGRIALRLGAKVELGVGPYGNGTQATIRLPLALFVDIADIPVVAPIVPAAAIGRHFPVPDPADTPEVASRPVDPAELTDGATGLGLPRRRVRSAEVGAEAPSVGTGPFPAVDGPLPAALHEPLPIRGDTIPDAPRADALAGAAATVSEDWTPPVAMSAPLAPRRRGLHVAPSDEPAGPHEPAERGPTPHPWTDGSSRRARNRRVAQEKQAALAADEATGSPANEPSNDEPGQESPERPGAFEPLSFDEAPGSTDWFGGTEPSPADLPSRTPSAPVAPALSWPSRSTPAPVAPEARASMFGGFRSRRAEVVAEQLEVHAPEQLASPAVEQIPAEQELDEPAPAALLVPLLVEDKEWESDDDVPLGIPVDYDAADATHVLVANPWEVGYEAPVPTADEDDDDWTPMPLDADVAEAVAPFVPGEATTDPLSPELSAPPVISPALDAAQRALPQAAEPVALPASWANGTAIHPIDEAESAADFSSLMSGEDSTAPVPARPKRRGMFARRRPKATGGRTAPPVAPAVPEPPAVVLPQPSVDEVVPPAVTPERQSAWSTNGSHVQHGWDPDDDGPDSERNLPAVQELASLSFRPTEAKVPVVEPPLPAAITRAPEVSIGSSWTPDPASVELLSFPGWPTLPHPAPAAAPVEGEPLAEPLGAGPMEPNFGTPSAPVDSSLPARPAAVAPPAAQRGFATFVPSDSRESDPISQRAGIAQQALSELSQLSSYRPKAAGTGGRQAAPLVRRTPAVIPKDEPATPRQRAAPRDANEVRSLLASFQSGTSRGRTAAEETEPEIAVDTANQGTSW